MRETRTSGSAGALGEQSPGATQKKEGARQLDAPRGQRIPCLVAFQPTSRESAFGWRLNASRETYPGLQEPSESPAALTFVAKPGRVVRYDDHTLSFCSK